ncbi:helix-turn-helix domain-containing protein [Novosphingobium pentaromativorans]|uniref:Chromosomal replication initiator DnaA C-terminal domain-containing protein n=1 Tax=Novosphingobium pentaromativorans US6-1 TaxID=1088721 RepID=G6E7H4_9SPHN|nr:helix-turn-helix domain-containing protein [Novosphingobium pentaromativorans]AIT81623.1 hypothetical protein JI59_18560 [Novosphingobium pentaromativorans US6-1]EHJ62797.1 hypothetical protein NSU_0309 [Novosphingobium pentaromativorans US6-1]
MARVADIITIASRLTGVSEHHIRGASRKREYIAVRFAVYAVSRDQGFSFPEIGAFVGGRDHSSVINGVRQIPTYERIFPNLAPLMDAMRAYAEHCEPFLADTGWRPSVGIDMTPLAMSDYAAVKAAAQERNRARLRLRREQDKIKAAEAEPVTEELDHIERADIDYRLMMMRGSEALREALFT